MSDLILAAGRIAVPALIATGALILLGLVVLDYALHHLDGEQREVQR
ncbi:MAG: hypothetical protein KIT69_09470 [Propionibacteriaceae bacterium]|nr:hypothetical protein [Propionibacteriaceae bacterium]